MWLELCAYSRTSFYVHVIYLSPAHRALKFEQPTDQERAVVAEVMASGSVEEQAMLMQHELPFDQLTLLERIGAGAFGVCGAVCVHIYMEERDEKGI